MATDQLLTRVSNVIYTLDVSTFNEFFHSPFYSFVLFRSGVGFDSPRIGFSICEIMMYLLATFFMIWLCVLVPLFISITYIFFFFFCFVGLFYTSGCTIFVSHFLLSYRRLSEDLLFFSSAYCYWCFYIFVERRSRFYVLLVFSSCPPHFEIKGTSTIIMMLVLQVCKLASLKSKYINRSTMCSFATFPSSERDGGRSLQLSACRSWHWIRAALYIRDWLNWEIGELYLFSSSAKDVYIHWTSNNQKKKYWTQKGFLFFNYRGMLACVSQLWIK